MSVPTLVIGAAHSGAGKTTVTLALIAALRRRGLKVQPFKVGPDYLDPSLLSWAAGRPCRNLDGWLLPPRHLLQLFHRACCGADLALVEGVMGLFDGKTGTPFEEDGSSTAAVAKLLGAPVLLVLDAQRASRTVGAVGLGMAQADPALRVAGVVLNRVASEGHRIACLEGLGQAGLPCLGHLGRATELGLPERYLGLVSAAETAPGPSLRHALAKAGTGLDLGSITAAARPAALPPPGPSLFPEHPLPTRARIAVAMDRAFHFYYRDSLDLLEAWGAELVPFSPLESPDLPPATGGVLLGGGYPELFAAELAANRPLRRALRRAARRGTLVYAECGGAMYASAGIEDAEGRRHRMLGLWPVWVTMRRPGLTVGYRRIRGHRPSFLANLELPGHEFHRSRLRGRTTNPAWAVLDQDGRPEGHAVGRVVASYIHLHLGARLGLAETFVDACAPR
ncbi:MAG TPA: cobyrinate a,c-diamide synthase [Candidatus Dormibacteraeota bacterium]|nr:cobyrinate a,c-diamide synthase [Candidatus Dormibacteraeota bacterium]